MLNERIQTFHKDRYREQVKASGGLLSKVQHRDPRHVALVCASTTTLTGSTNLMWTVVDWPLQVAGRA